MAVICPRCSVAEIAESGHCALCGYSPATSVILQEPAINEVQEVVQRATADRFRIQVLLRLGERSMVFLAHEVAHDREVALKVIPVREGVSQTLAHRFERQVRLYQSLKQAHIVPVHASGTAATFLWYTLDPMRGQSLADLLRESGPLSVETCLGVADQVATALDYAHRRGVVHGNLKPSNVFLDDRWVRVSDFAILDAFGRQGPGHDAGPWLRLPEYMAPEQFYARTPVASVDQYALAVLIYQCLSGTPPFVGDSFEEVARQHAQDRPPPLANTRQDVPVAVSEALTRALSKQPTGRFPSVMDFVTALGAAPAPAPSRVPPRNTPASPARTTPKPAVLVVEPEQAPKRRWWLMGLVAVAALAGGAALALRDRGGATASLQPFETLEPAATAAPAATLPAPVTQAPSPAPPRGTAAPPVAAPRPTPAVTPSGPPATLLINTTPWGQLFVDGTLMGNTPKANIPLRPGRHLIRVTREGFEPFERELVVEPGQVVRLTGIVLQPRSS